MALTPLPTAITDRIPIEIYKQIIDNLYHSTPSLSSCSTVCKAWLPACRYYLFQEVKLSPGFVQFLCDSTTTSSVLPYVRTVALGGVWFDQERGEQIIQFMVRMSSPREMIFETWSWNYLGNDAEKLLMTIDSPFFTNITTISMTYVRFPSLAVLKSFLGRFTQLKTLALDNTTWDEETPDSAESSCAFGPMPQISAFLQQLEICSSSVGPLLAWIFPASCLDILFSNPHRIPHPCLQSLAIPEVLEHEVLIVQHALHQLGPSLQALEIGFVLHDYGAGYDPDGLLSLLDVSHNTELRHLHLANVTLYRIPFRRSLTSFNNANANEGEVAQGDQAFHWVSSLLSSVKPCTLRLLVVSLWLTSEADVDLFEWQSMGRLLANEQLHDDFALQFRIFGIPEGGKNVKQWIQSRLSILPDVQAREIQLEYA